VPRKHATGQLDWMFWGRLLGGTLATWVVPLTFDNNADVCGQLLPTSTTGLCLFAVCHLHSAKQLTANNGRQRDLLVERLATYTLLAASYDEMAWPRANIDDVCSVI